MNIAQLSIKRPIFITTIVLAMLTFGVISISRLGVDLYPDVSLPIVSVTTVYAGAAPEEIEKLISKPLEEELGTIGGIKHLYANNIEGLSMVVLEFTLETDIRQAEQSVRDKVSLARNKLPKDIDEPLIQRLDPSDTPILRLALVADLSQSDIYDLAKENIKQQIVRIDGVGDVKIVGGARREIQVELDQNRLNEYRIPMLSVVRQMQNAGSNIPVGKREHGATETSFRAIGEYTNLKEIEDTLITFSGDIGSSVTVKSLGTVRDGNEDIKNMAYLYYPFKSGAADEKSSGKIERSERNCIYLDVKKQSGANSVKVVDQINKQLSGINDLLKKTGGNPQLIPVLDTTRWIRINVEDVYETIVIGIFLAVFVVYLFLGNVRSTIITGIAIPNSLLGAFIVMYAMGFTINVITLLALSLTVGLLVDDAIVVRENIFRKLEEGMPSREAAELGTAEVALAVIATTLTVIAVFLPIGMLEGIIGRFFMQFGFTVVFAMLVSLFDALTVAPLLSAYFAGKGEKEDNFLIKLFEKFQQKLEEIYKVVMEFCLQHTLLVIITTMAVFLGSISLLMLVKQTFISEADSGMFSVSIEMPTGTSLKGSESVIRQIDQKMRTLEDLDYMAVTVGGNQDEPNKAKIDCFLVPAEQRKKDTLYSKGEVRKMLVDFAYARPSVDEVKISSMEDRPFVLTITGNDRQVVEDYADKLLVEVKQIKDLVEVDSSVERGKPEFQVYLNPVKMKELGVAQTSAGLELRYNIAGAVVGTFNEKGLEYDVRVRLKPDQRDLRYSYVNTKVPNIHNMPVPLTAITDIKNTTGSGQISRQDRAYVVAIRANIAPDGAIGAAMERVREITTTQHPVPAGVRTGFVGQSESFGELVSGIITALVLSIIFIYLVLSALYESFITPFTILLAIPPALTGAFLSLLITGYMLDLFSMIGMVMLMGLVTKNSILLVDFGIEGVRSGMNRKDAIFRAGLLRLRPILMTTFAMMAGTLPLALGIGEAAKTRQSMGIAILGGLFISTVITLVVVPATFEYIDRFREAIESKFRIKEEEDSQAIPEPEPEPAEEKPVRIRRKKEKE